MRSKLALLLALSFLAMAAERPPWRARRRPDVQPSRLAAQRVSPDDWVAEPVTPAELDSERLAGALREICGWMPPSRSRQYADWVLESGREFDVDPLLLGAMIYRESRCRSDREELGGLGLTLIAPRMYQGGFKGRNYRYYVRDGGGRWLERTKHLPRFPFVRGRMLSAESNLYLAAGLLSVWKEQHATVDATFEQVPHRHYVSHWVWGDRVRSARAEDRILTDRRRLLRYYGALAPAAPIERGGLAIGSPLDGAPRVVSSGLGFVRDGGERSHRGIDIESEFGEPVRAIATGEVIFSGVDLPGRQHNEILDPEQTNEYDRSRLGRGGRYLCLRHHRPTAGPLRSCYMHLETVEVRAGDSVELGQRIGTVGRTGMRRSAPHLHLEIHSDEGVLDPLDLLGTHVVGKPVPFEEPKRKRRHRHGV